MSAVHNMPGTSTFFTASQTADPNFAAVTRVERSEQCFFKHEADLPWRSRLVCHRSRVREALGSNPRAIALPTSANFPAHTLEELSFPPSPRPFFQIVTEQGGTVPNHWAQIQKNMGFILGPAILIAFYHAFRKSLRRMLGSLLSTEHDRFLPADLPWRSRLVCHRSRVREALGSNPRAIALPTSANFPAHTLEELSFPPSPRPFFQIVTEQGGTVPNHWAQIQKNMGFILGPAILIAFYHAFRKSLRRMLGSLLSTEHDRFLPGSYFSQQLAQCAHPFYLQLPSPFLTSSESIFVRRESSFSRPQPLLSIQCTRPLLDRTYFRRTLLSTVVYPLPLSLPRACFLLAGELSGPWTCNPPSPLHPAHPCTEVYHQTNYFKERHIADTILDDKAANIRNNPSTSTGEKLGAWVVNKVMAAKAKRRMGKGGIIPFLFPAFIAHGSILGGFSAISRAVNSKGKGMYLKPYKVGLRQKNSKHGKKSALTNKDIHAFVKIMDIPYFRGVYIRDDLPKKPNLHECIVIRNKWKEHFGLHKLRPPIELSNYFKNMQLRYNYQTEQLPNTINCVWFPVLELDGEWQISLIAFVTFNSIPNIDKHNQTFMIVILAGSYELDDLDTIIKVALSENVYF
ncbi:hypothetical protein PR048_005788 [Dryococelus australis]|uniref:Uncharacterized protein n=1 Tax=Dryococelus australis TaxID=614101 RepID=A0ABQ9I961_9NEOP|nr:hypothetical protein PR048_005788 [Dryococelus australis]